ncbi:MAG: hypothetical protein CMA00_004550 [Methanobacteriota archaeon]|nr:MAG: hypothetical protein CMA00_004550 [Euryarchaeota archaeon]
MRKQISTLVLLILLSSTLNIQTQQGQAVAPEESELASDITRIEISPDPDRIRDLGLPAITDGQEGNREVWADSSIGVYTKEGLILREDVPEELREFRPDLMVAIISPHTGLWDARGQILENSEVAIRTTIPPSGFLIQGSPESLKSIMDLPFVEASHSVPVAMVVDSQLWGQTGSSEEVEITGWKDDDLLRLDTPGFGLGESLEALAKEKLEHQWSPTGGIHFGSLETSIIPDIAMKPQVAFISKVLQISTWNDQSRLHMGVGQVESFFFTGLDGSNQTVAVADSGIDHDHGDFGSRITQKVDVANDGSTSDPSDGHGTHVACTVLGSGSRDIDYRGVAPEASLYMQAMEDEDTGGLSSPGVFSLLNTAYSSGGARIHTNSWGSFNSGGVYSTQSEDADDRTSTWDQYWAYDGMTVLFAAGNERNDGISPPGTAKNVITVGAHQNRYDQNAEDLMYYYSSRGPTDDGRIKPDIVAAGQDVRSCRAQEASDAPDNLNNQWYLEYDGTSMATPAAAGASAIVRQYLIEVAERPEPQGALVKAMLILGAEDMATRDIPNNIEGWGRLNLVNTLLPDNDVGDIGVFVDDRSRLQSGQEANYNFDVTRSGEPLKVVVAWSDYPGSTFSTTQLRNDLDLEVTSPDGVTYLGNDFSNGRSTTGGAKDSKNNVEVVLIDSATTGIWNVKVKDFSHGGNRQWQPFAVAVRGVNVNDLTPDPAIDPDSFEISTPIPQVGEETTFSVSIVNQGSGSFPGVFVSAHVNDNLVETKSLGMTPGENVKLEWDWTPETEDRGNTEIRIEIDPSDQLEELYEDNNILTEFILVSAPGIQATSESPWKTLQDPSSTNTKWEIVMTNLAAFETNASIQASQLTRKLDGKTFDWFSSFDQPYVLLGPSASTTVNLTLGHPAPPDPGTYSMVITATDEDFDVESQLELFFDVPVLGQPEVTLPSETIGVDSFNITNTSVVIYNRGNGAQTYDIEVQSPAGWQLGFVDLGTFQGSNQGSTGTLSEDGSINARIAVNPPGVLLGAGTTFTAQLLVKSRVSSDVWSYDLPLVVNASDSAEFTPPSGDSQGEVPADSLHEISLQVSNNGNRELHLTPIERSLPGGWQVQGGLEAITVPVGSSSDWAFSIQGNGFAEGGLIEIRFLVEGGDFFDWTTSLDAVSGAVPVVSFYEVVLVEGQSIQNSTTPLGLGAHPVGKPFDFGWTVENEGTSNWEPAVSMETPDDEWVSSCNINPKKIIPGQKSTVWCSITIPSSQEAGSEPIVTMVLSGDGIEVRKAVSLLVETVRAVEWSLADFGETEAGLPTTLNFELENSGNTLISSRIVVEGPSEWDIRILDEMMVTLQPGEIRSVRVSFTPNSGSDDVISVKLANSEDIPGYSKSVEVEVKSGSGGGGSGALIYFVGATLLVSIGAASAAFAFYRSTGESPLASFRGRSNKKIKPKKENLEQTFFQVGDQGAQPTSHESNQEEDGLQSYSEYPGWLWDPSIEEWVPDPGYNQDAD